MDVRCDRCHTEYEFDEARLTEAGVAVRCTSCGNVFKVSKPPSLAAPIDLERPRQWKVRRNDGQVYALKDLPELQRWIVERRVSRDDEVSLSGEAWRKLGGMPELASFFDVVEAAEQAQHKAAAEPVGSAATMVSPAVSAPTPAWGSPAAHPPSTGSGTWAVSPQALAATPTSEPAWTASPSVSALDSELGEDDLRHVRGSPWPGILATLIVLAGLGGAGWFIMKQMQKNQPAPKPPPTEAAEPGAPVAPTGMAPAPTAPTGAVAATAPSGPMAPAATGPSSPTGATAATGAAPPAPTAPTGAEAETAPKPAGEGAAPTKPEAKPGAKPEVKPEAKAETPAEAKPAARPEGEGAKGGHDFNWYVSRGHKLLDTHPSQALAMFEQASQVNPSSPEPDSGRGIAYSNLEQWGKAITAFQAAIKKNPEYSEAVMGLAEAYRYKGDKPQAVLYYKRYLELTPDGPDAPAAKAQIQSLKGE
jgi:predicted Zn finger-like uncharacterized protein